MVPAFCRSAVIHAMPERLAPKRSWVDIILTAELAPAFAALLQASKWSNYRENAFLIGRFFNFVISVSTRVWERQAFERCGVCLRLYLFRIHRSLLLFSQSNNHSSQCSPGRPRSLSVNRSISCGFMLVTSCCTMPHIIALKSALRFGNENILFPQWYDVMHILFLLSALPGVSLNNVALVIGPHLHVKHILLRLRFAKQSKPVKLPQKCIVCGMKFHPQGNPFKCEFWKYSFSPNCWSIMNTNHYSSRMLLHPHVTISACYSISTEQIFYNSGTLSIFVIKRVSQNVYSSKFDSIQQLSRFVFLTVF